MWILDTVEGQQQQLLVAGQRLFNEVTQSGLVQRLATAYLGDHPLVAGFTADLMEARPIRGLYLDAAIIRLRYHGFQPWICRLVLRV